MKASLQLPITPEIELLVNQLPDEEKKTLSLLIGAFVSRPKRSISQVMDDMASYAKKQGLNPDNIGNMLKEG